MSKLVTDDMVEAALTYLATASKNGASARANRLRAEFKRKRLRSKLILNITWPAKKRSNGQSRMSYIAGNAIALM